MHFYEFPMYTVYKVILNNHSNFRCLLLTGMVSQVIFLIFIFNEKNQIFFHKVYWFFVLIINFF